MEEPLSPIIEIVEFIDAEDNLIQSFTRELKLEQQDLNRGTLELASNGVDHSEKAGSLTSLSIAQDDNRLDLSEAVGIAELPRQNIEKKQKQKPPARVTFADLDDAVVKEAQDQPLETTKPNKPRLRFRQRLDKKNSEDLSNKPQKSIAPNGFDASKTNSGDLIEDDEYFNRLKDELKQENMKDKMSNYKRMTYQNSNSKTRDIVPEPIVEPSNEHLLEYVEEDELTGSESRPTIDLANIDVTELPDDLETLVQAYDFGLFDDHTKTNVVEKLEDFEILNAMIEAEDKDESQDHTHEASANEPSIEKYSSFKHNDNFDIMADDIIENEIAEDSEDEDEMDEFYNYDEIQQNVLDRDIRQHYFRLRNKLYPSKAAEDMEEMELSD